ncbi:MAG: RNA-binding S4 domain-containing protein [Mangrovicoccus sp.]
MSQSQDATRQRVDKWLWFARFFKTRTLAAEKVTGGKLRINGSKIRKASAQVGPGDMLTFVQAGKVRLIRVEAMAERRGSAQEAQKLYTDLDLAANAEQSGASASSDRS